MKIASIVARILLGALFVFGGSNHLFNFVPAQPLPPGPAGQFIAGMTGIGYLTFIGVMEVIGGLLIITQQFVPFGLTILGPIVVNILVVEALIMPKAVLVAVVMIVLWVVSAWPLRRLFFPLLQRKASA
jgi:putative oxidoreductase